MELNEIIEQEISNKHQSIISNHNLHSLYIYYHDKIMRRFYSVSKYIHIDGMSLILLGRLFGKPLQRQHRVTYVDWVKPLMQEAVDKEWRIFYLGSKPGVADKAAEILRDQHPSLQMKTHHGYFELSSASEENNKLLQIINDYQPQILMVGMGMPRQERWILDNIEKIPHCVILTAGACMDYVANEIPSPPRWMGRLGLEWLFRLYSEPKRLWRRYLLEPWFIAQILILHVVFRKKKEVAN